MGGAKDMSLDSPFCKWTKKRKKKRQTDGQTDRQTEREKSKREKEKEKERERKIFIKNKPQPDYFRHRILNIYLQ